jgi:hypothetical protein
VQSRSEPDYLTVVRKGQGAEQLSRREIEARFRARFFDPALDAHQEAIQELLETDADHDLHEEVRNAARALGMHVEQRRAGLKAPDETLENPRPK